MSINILIILQNFFYFFIAIIGLNSAIVIHEFGHWVFCKIFGISTPVFSVGVGPTIIQKKIGETNFVLAAIPLGGFVEIFTDEENRSTPKNFYSLSYLKKMTILLGGIFFNILSVFFVFFIMFQFWGAPEATIKSIKIESVENNSICKEKIYAKDVLIGVEDILFDQKAVSLVDFRDLIINKKGSTINFLVQSGKDVDEVKKVEIDIPSSDLASGILGLNLQPDVNYSFLKNNNNFLQNILLALTTVWTHITAVTSSFKTIFLMKNFTALSGPVMILKESSRSAAKGLVGFILFLCMISINVAILNFLPLGVLDGGRLFTVTIEAIARRPLHYLTLIINIASIILLGGLTLMLTIKEIWQLVR